MALWKDIISALPNIYPLSKFRKLFYLMLKIALGGKNRFYGKRDILPNEIGYIKHPCVFMMNIG